MSKNEHFEDITKNPGFNCVFRNFKGLKLRNRIGILCLFFSQCSRAEKRHRFRFRDFSSKTVLMVTFWTELLSPGLLQQHSKQRR